MSFTEPVPPSSGASMPLQGTPPMDLSFWLSTAAPPPVAVPRAVGEPRTLAERAYLALRRDIIQGQLQPGQRLRVEHLKDVYDVGAGTLREALSLLVSDALVQAEGQRGFRVAETSLSDLEDVTQMRVMLETEALRQSIRHGDARWEARVREAWARLSAAETDRNAHPSGHWEQCNQHFHEALISAQSSHWSRHFLGILYRHGERYRLMARRLVSEHFSDRNVHEEHETLFRAAIERQEARAALALEVHVRATAEVLRKQVKAGTP